MCTRFQGPQIHPKITSGILHRTRRSDFCPTFFLLVLASVATGADGLPMKPSNIFSDVREARPALQRSFGRPKRPALALKAHWIHYAGYTRPIKMSGTKLS